MTATGEILSVHMEAIDEALNGLAADSDIPPDDYVEALDEIAHRCQMAAHAVRLETGRDREWADFVLTLEQWLNSKPTPGARSQDTARKAVDFHMRLRRWEDQLVTSTDKAKRKALDDRLLIEVFEFDPEVVKS